MRYGWRARIGHIAPAILDTSGEEMRKLLPEGVLHVGLTISEPKPPARRRKEHIDIRSPALALGRNHRALGSGYGNVSRGRAGGLGARSKHPKSRIAGLATAV